MSAQTNVVQLKTATPEAHPEMVRMVEALLVRVKSGEVLSLAVAVQLTGGETGTVYSLAEGDVAHLVCAMERLKIRLLDARGE